MSICICRSVNRMLSLDLIQIPDWHGKRWFSPKSMKCVFNFGRWIAIQRCVYRSGTAESLEIQFILWNGDGGTVQTRSLGPLAFSEAGEAEFHLTRSDAAKGGTVTVSEIVFHPIGGTQASVIRKNGVDAAPAHIRVRTNAVDGAGWCGFQREHSSWAD